MARNPLKEYLRNACKEDESCISIVQASFDALEAQETNVGGVVATFADAALGRGQDVSEVIRLVEAAPEGKIFLPENWGEIRDTILKALKRVEPMTSNAAIQEK